MFNVLYQIQVWMSDHIRAAMTCIHFYRNKASSYSDLVSNLSHLEMALLHLQTALKQPAGWSFNVHFFQTCVGSYTKLYVGEHELYC